MPVETNRATGEWWDLCIIQGPACRGLTTHWWGDGCVPVCPTCSELPDVTDTSMRELATKRGWGPIPKHNTDKGGTASSGGA